MINRRFEMQSMKVLYILHTAEMHGATMSFLSMLQGLIGNGVKAFVVVPQKNNLFENKIKEIGASLFVLPICYSIIPSYSHVKQNIIKRFTKLIWHTINLCIKKFHSFCAVYRISRAIRPDIIHTNVGIIHEGFWCAKILRVPHVWHIREYQDLDFDWMIFPSKKLFQKELCNSNVIAISEGLIEHFGQKTNEKAICIYNGIYKIKDVTIVLPKKEYFLLASRISPSKGHEDVIRAFASFYMKHSGYRLVILGSGPDKYIEDLKTITHTLHCEKAIDWMGFQKDVRSFMKDAKALIVASHFEGFGRMTAEASFAGCMVIGRDTGGTKEILEQTKGITFFSVEELEIAMCKVAEMNESEYLRKIEYAQKKAVEKFSIEQNVIKVNQLYENILDQKSKTDE